MSVQKTESLVPATAAKMDNVKDSFTVFCWNVLTEGNTDYHKAAMLKEMSDPPRDLVFLQEMSAQPDGEKGHEYIPYKAVPYYGVHYTREQTGNIHNVILYNTEKFEEEPHYKTVLLEAYCSLQWQVDCFNQWQTMEDEKVKLEREREALEMEKEKQKEKLKQDEGNNELHQKVDSLKNELEKKQKKLEDIQHDLLLADGPTWGKLPEKVADKHTEETITEAVQYIVGIWNKCRPRDKIYLEILECDRKTITDITCNCSFSSRKSEINVLVNCLLRESGRETNNEGSGI